MKIATWIARTGITNALLFVRSRMDRAQSHVALDRLHALVAEILAIESRRDRGIVLLLDSCVAFDAHDSCELHMLSLRVFDLSPIADSSCMAHRVIGCICQVY